MKLWLKLLVPVMFAMSTGVTEEGRVEGQALPPAPWPPAPSPSV